MRIPFSFCQALHKKLTLPQRPPLKLLNLILTHPPRHLRSGLGVFFVRAKLPRRRKSSSISGCSQEKAAKGIKARASTPRSRAGVKAAKENKPAW